MLAYQREWRRVNREKCNAYQRAYRAAHPELKAKRTQKAREFRDKNPGYYTTPEQRAKQVPRSRKHKLKRYGLTLEQFDTMRAKQENRCAICQQIFLVTPRVDHDHEKGTARALLCGNCNTGVGMFQDSARVAFMAASYLQSHGKA
jgi:hypothetical protein